MLWICQLVGWQIVKIDHFSLDDQQGVDLEEKNSKQSS